MKLILLIAFIPSVQVSQGESLKEVIGYLGDNVILPSGADPSWVLSKIEWSIFSNTTWIITYRNGKVGQFVPRYEGRLTLNTSSGDLMIHKLNPGDAREYTVELRNKAKQSVTKSIRLTVTERLESPIIKTISSTPMEGGCWVVLECSSTDEGVAFSWLVDPPTANVSALAHPRGNSAVLLAFLNNTRDLVKFTCCSRGNMKMAQSSITPECHEEKPQPGHVPDPKPRCRDGVRVFFGGVLGGFLTVLLIYLFKGGRKHLVCFPDGR